MNSLTDALKELIKTFPNACIKCNKSESDYDVLIDVLDRNELFIFSPCRGYIAKWIKVENKMLYYSREIEFCVEKSEPIPDDYIKVSKFLAFTCRETDSAKRGRL